jgi:hypothetical protein
MAASLPAGEVNLMFATSTRRPALRRTAALLLFLAPGLILGSAPSTASSRAPAGSIRGQVGVSGSATLSGAPPAGKAIDMTGDDYCGRVNAGQQVLDRTVVADEQGRLAEVVVYVKEGLARGNHPVPQEPVTLDQQNCMYRPRVLALRANQPFIIRNSDETLHNVHVRAKSNREFNVGQPMKGIQSRRTFSSAEVGIHVACDIHGWMAASIAVFDHPYFAVTGADGSFSIADLPPGQYLIEAWHATLGTQQQRIAVTAGAAAEVRFVFAQQ